MNVSQILSAGGRSFTRRACLPYPSRRAPMEKNPLEVRYSIEPRPRFTLALFLGLVAAVTLPLRAQKPSLEEVATFPKQQVTGVTVSAKGRVFVNFPFWSDDHTLSVAEIIDGKPKTFPDEAWDAKSGSPQGRWICVQSVVVDDQGALWILDPASPKTEGVVKGGAKLVKVDLSTNKVVQTILFDETVAPTRSYLNDVRVDTKTGHAFITDSGAGAIVVVDLKTGQARRLLANHPSTKVELGAEIVVDGMKIIDPKTGKAPDVHADGIAFDKKGGWLYYHPLTGVTLYRVKTEHLLDETLSDAQLGAKVEKITTTPKPDGMLEAPNGSVYLTAFEKNAIVRFDPDTQEVTTIIEDDLLQWPDTLAWGPDGKLYVTTSQIHRMPKYHGGQSKQKGPFAVYRLEVPSS
jgi:sugar lactone lactonase YvrE